MEIRPPYGEIRGTIVVAQRRGVEKMRLCEELEATKREAQAYKDEFTARTELKNELAEKANRCHALMMELEMNASADQICVLKDKIKRAKANLQHSYNLLEQ
ncbi:hypothetical protein ACOSQ3_014198 [Xanthoceras sorbifolium]